MTPTTSLYLTDPFSSSPESLETLTAFVKSHHPYGWSQTLLDHCWLMEVTADDELIALVWFNRVCPGVIECHACALPEWRGRWLKRDVLYGLRQIIGVTGCRACIIQITTPLVRRICRRLGFKVLSKIAILELGEAPDGTS